MSQAPVQIGIDVESLRAFRQALRRYVLVTGKTVAQAARRQLRNVLIKARAAIVATPREEIPNFADGSVAHCKIVAWRLAQRVGRTIERNRAGQWVSYRRTRSASGRTRRRDSNLLRSGRTTYSREYAKRFAEKMTRTRMNHARFSRLLFTRAMKAIVVASTRKGTQATVRYRHLYRATLTNALQSRALSARRYQPAIDRAIAAGLRGAARDMADYIDRRLAGQWR